MPIFKVEAPDGQIIKVDAPEGSSQDDIISFAEANYKPIKRETGATGAFKASTERLKGEAALLGGKLGVMDEADAEEYRARQERKAQAKFQPTEKGWTEAPFEKLKELAGGSAPYMLAPAAAAGAVALSPAAGAAVPLGIAGLSVGAPAIAAGLASGAQFTGSNLGRQMETDKKLSETSLPAAVGAAIPQALLDTLGMKMIPGVRQLFAKSGVELSEKAAEEIAKRGLMSTAKEYGGKALVTAGAEGTTEATQQVFERLQAGLNLTDPEARKEYFDNFIGGAALGGTLAVPGHYFEKSSSPRLNEQPTPVAEQTPGAAAANPEPSLEQRLNEVAPAPDVSEVGRESVTNPLLWAQTPQALNAEQDEISLAAKQAKVVYDQEREQNQIGGKIDQTTPMGMELAKTQEQMEVLAKQAQPLLTPSFKPTFAEAEATLPTEVEKPVVAPSEPPKATPEMMAQVESVKNTLVPALRRYGLGDVGLRIVDSIENGTADGYYAQKLITVALDTKDHLGTLRHESIHALKNLNAFTPQEWQVLSNKAKSEWIPQFIGPERMKAYETQYAKDNNGDLDGFNDYIQEEAIADAFKHYKNKFPPGLIGNLMYRLKQLFQSLGNTFRGHGFTTSDKIFTGIEQTKYGTPTKVEPIGKFNLRTEKPTGKGIVAEVAPNPDQEVAQAWREMSPSERLTATKAVGNKVVPRLIDELGLKGYAYRTSSGKYEGETNPNIIIDAPDNATEAELSELARLIGYALDQKAMVAYDENNTTSNSQAGFVKVMIPSGMNEDGLNKLREHIAREVPQADADTVRDDAILFGNFSEYNDNVETVSDEQFRESIAKAIEGFEYDGEISVSEPLRFHSELVWPDTREGYLEGTRYGNGEDIPSGAGTDVRGQGRSRIESIAREGIELRDKWINAREASRQPSGEKPSTVGIPPVESEYGTPQKGAVSAVGVHYSKEKRERISSKYHGAGLKGAEKERLEDTANKDIRDRIYFYVSKGKGVFPESGVGGQPHSIKLNNLYDVDKDHLKIVKNNRGSTAEERATNIERSIINAGFDGYVSTQGTGRQGYAVLIGKHEISVPKKYSLRAPETDAFKQWFGNSVTVDAKGEPMVLYHGTAQDITEFKPKQAGAIFVTARPQFAESFSGASEMYMKRELFDTMSMEERRDVFRKALEVSKNDGNVSPKEYSSLKARLNSIDATYGNIPPGIEVEVQDILGDMLPTRANILPVFVKAENPFSYSNKDQVRDVINWLKKNEGLDDRSAETLEGRLLRGSWAAIERDEVQRAIKAMGHDSFFVLEAGTKNLAVYEPSQIKSATGNKGTYDIKNPDIRYSLRNAPPLRLTKLQPNLTAGEAVHEAVESVREVFHEDKNEFWTKLRINWVDPNSGLTKRLQELPIFDSKGQLRADMLNRAKAQSINLIRNGLTTGIPVLNKDGSIIIKTSKENNLANSLNIADALNSNEMVKESGMTGRDYVAEVARALRAEEIEKEDAAHNAATGEDRQRNKAIKPDQIAWAQKQMSMVPELKEIFKIWKEINTGLLNLWEETGLLDKKAADEFRSKTAYVSLARSVEDMEENMATQLGFTSSGLKSVRKVHGLEGSLQDVNIWENVDKQYAMMTAAAYQNQVRKVAVEQLVSLDMARYTNSGDKNVNLRYKDPTSDKAGKDGVVSVIVDNPTDLAAFESVHYELNPIIKAMSAATGTLRAGALLNPMFWIRQLVRDPIQAALTNSPVVTPLHSAKEYIKLLQKDSPEGQLLAERGVIGPVDSNIDLQEFLQQAGKQYAGNPSGLQKAVHKMMAMHEASDAATRVAIFKKAKAEALARGLSEERAVDEAVFKARESINFSVTGNSALLHSLRHMTPFLTAAIASLDVLYRAATGYGLPKEQRAEAKALFKKRAAMMVAMSIAYAMMMQDDDEYKKTPDYIRDNNWLVKNPMGEGFIKIPVPYEVGFLMKTIPEAAIRYMSGNSSGKEVIKSYLNGVGNSLPGDAVPLPQLMKPAYEVITNHSLFTGAPIESLGEMHLPTEQRGRNASETSKLLSEAGLGKIGLSPSKIDHLTQGYFAELGLFSTFLMDKVITEAKGETPMDKNLAQQPFFKSFLTDPTRDKAVSDFYEINKTANEVSAAFNEYKKTGQVEAAKEIMADEEQGKLLKAAPALRRVAKNMTEINNKIKYIKEKQDMDPAERLERVNALQKQLGIVARQHEKILKAVGYEE